MQSVKNTPLLHTIKGSFKFVPDDTLFRKKKKSEKMRLDDSCELSAKMIHIKCQALFSQEKNVCCSKWRFKGLFLGI